MNLLRSLGAAAFGVGLPLTCLSSNLLAQTPISGNQSGTLAAGVYHATGSLVVPAGQTWTLNPGVIIKFTSAFDVTIVGTLLANGTAANSVIFSAVADDSAGGDTNNNGPSVGSPAAWRGLIFTSTSSASLLRYTDVRYGGSGYVSNMHLSAGANPTFDHCISRNNFTHGINLNGAAQPIITNCTITGNSGNAIDSVPIAALAGFSNNTATGNSGNFARVTVGGVTGAVSLGAQALLSGAFMFDTSIIIAQGGSLTLGGGVICKFMSGHEVNVSGTLVTNGVNGNPVIFTDDGDDTAGGDTNTNGASTGVPAGWRGIIFQATSAACVLNYADLRYGGSGYVSNIHLNSANPTLNHCVISNNYTHGMNLNGNSFPTVTNCSFTGNNGNAVDGVPIAALPGFTNNTATGNSGNFARVTIGTVTGNLAIAAHSMLGTAFYFDCSPVVAQGASLTFGAGSICKFVSGQEVTVHGTLLTNGVNGNPVIFTDDADDSAGGDTNNNGPSVGVPAAWRGIVFQPTSTGCVLAYADVRYGGAAFVSNIHLNSASPTLNHCVIRNNYTHGMNLLGTSAPTVTDCTFTNNAGNAVEGMLLTSVPGFTNNSATGNGGNFMRITGGIVSSYLRIGAHSILEGALMIGTAISVPAGGYLAVDQGVNFKLESGQEVTVSGTLDLRGTGYEPVTFTSATDDSVAGDTNNNGPSVGSPAAWRGITIQPTSAQSRLENVVIRFTGAGFVPGLTASSPTTMLRSVRVDRAYDRGFLLSGLAMPAVNLVAWGCGGIGLHLTGGTFDVLHATCATNSVGLQRDVQWIGNVRNSISYANGTNFTGFGTGAQVYTSNGGFTTVHGNLNVDPLFVASASGNLHLSPASSCLGVGEFVTALAVVKDFDENSRLLDHALIGNPAPDLGAFELPAWDMTVSSPARIGTTTTLTIVGPAGESFLVMGILDGVTPLAPWGMLTCGLPGPSIALLFPVTIPTGVPIPLTLANAPALVGAVVGLQTLTFPTGNLSVGNFTRLLRVLVRP